MSYYRNQLEDWVKTIVPEGDVLDVGGGEKPVRDRVDPKFAKFKILDHDARYNPDYFADINYMYDCPKSFDVVFCLEVFEYIWNPVQAMENVCGFLKDNGVAYISFPTIYPVHNPPGIDYLRYTRFGIEKLLAVGGFKSWEITPRVATAGLRDLSNFYSNEGMHPLKDGIVTHIGYLVKAFK